MKYFFIRKYYSLLLLIVLFSGCASSNNLYKSNNNLNKKKLKNSYVLLDSNAKAEMSNRFFVYIPITAYLVDADGALDKLSNELLDRYGADLLTNVKLETGWLFTVYYNTYTYYLTADVWRKK